MDRHLIAQHLELAERHVTQSQKLVARQRDLIAEMGVRGLNIDVAQDFLAVLELGQIAHIRDRNRILHELAEADA